jgi:GNAT superfamily N-acetyltransferase
MLQLQIAALKSIGDGYYTLNELAALIESKQSFHTAGMYYYGQDRHVTLVAIIATKVVGFASLEHQLITAVFVDPQYTRQKIATRLLIGLEQIAIKLAISKLKVTSSLNARCFYTSCGYQSIGRGKIWLGLNLERIAIVKMEKRLLPSSPCSWRRCLAKSWQIFVQIFRQIW